MSKIDEILDRVNVHSTFRHWGYHTDPDKDKQEAKQAILADLLALPELQVNGNFDDYDEDEEVGAKCAIRDICQALIDYFEGVEK